LEKKGVVVSMYVIHDIDGHYWYETSDGGLQCVEHGEVERDVFEMSRQKAYQVASRLPPDFEPRVLKTRIPKNKEPVLMWARTARLRGLVSELVATRAVSGPVLEQLEAALRGTTCSPPRHASAQALSQALKHVMGLEKLEKK